MVELDKSFVRMPRTIERHNALVGQVFGRWSVKSWAGRASGTTANRSHYFLCECICGNTGVLAVGSLKQSLSKSCGCLQLEWVIENGKKYITHGKSKTAEYRTWSGIRQRCNNTEDKDYSDYGGRGIEVCNRWECSFENFYADMGERPSREHSIDRRDNMKGYTPSNCYWATRQSQHQNTRSNVMSERLVRYVRASGKSSTDLSEELGITRATINDVRSFRTWKNIT